MSTSFWGENKAKPLPDDAYGQGFLDAKVARWILTNNDFLDYMADCVASVGEDYDQSRVDLYLKGFVSRFGYELSEMAAEAHDVVGGTGMGELKYHIKTSRVRNRLRRLLHTNNTPTF